MTQLVSTWPALPVSNSPVPLFAIRCMHRSILHGLPWQGGCVGGGGGGRAHSTAHQHMASKAAAPLQALEQQGAEAEAEAQGAEAREAAVTARSEALKEGVALMWQRLGCQALGLEELLGEEGVTDANLMQYLGIIEQRVNQLLLVRSATSVLLPSLIRDSERCGSSQSVRYLRCRPQPRAAHCKLTADVPISSAAPSAVSVVLAHLCSPQALGCQAKLQASKWNWAQVDGMLAEEEDLSWYCMGVIRRRLRCRPPRTRQPQRQSRTQRRSRAQRLRAQRQAGTP